MRDARVIAPELHEPWPRYMRNRRRNAYLRANRGVDPALLAADLGVSEWFVVRVQRKLGLRAVRNKGHDRE